MGILLGLSMSMCAQKNKKAKSLQLFFSSADLKKV